ncbi:MAG: hypothetical protein ILO36_00060 [Abditibacteriota bacterium]|nr:hypothetical protein [Abditibacteriota bacterium]
MKTKIIALLLVAAFAAGACFAAGGYTLKSGYKANTRYTYKTDDEFKLTSAMSFGRNLLDQVYELEVKSTLYERPLSVDKYGNVKLKSYAEINRIELNDVFQTVRQNGDFQVAVFSPLNQYKNIVQTSIDGAVKNYEGSEAKYPVFVHYSDMIYASFVLPKNEVQLGETWIPEPIKLDKNGYIKSEFAITQIKNKNGETIANIHGTSNAVVDVESAVRFFGRVLPRDLLTKSKRYTGQAQIQVTDFEVEFSLTKGIIRELDVNSYVNLTITDSSSGATINAVIEADMDRELKSVDSVK